MLVLKCTLIRVISFNKTLGVQTSIAIFVNINQSRKLKFTAEDSCASLANFVNSLSEKLNSSLRIIG